MHWHFAARVALGGAVVWILASPSTALAEGDPGYCTSDAVTQGYMGAPGKAPVEGSEVVGEVRATYPGLAGGDVAFTGDAATTLGSLLDQAGVDIDCDSGCRFHVDQQGAVDPALVGPDPFGDAGAQVAVGRLHVAASYATLEITGRAAKMLACVMNMDATWAQAMAKQVACPISFFAAGKCEICGDTCYINVDRCGNLEAPGDGPLLGTAPDLCEPGGAGGGSPESVAASSGSGGTTTAPPAAVHEREDDDEPTRAAGCGCRMAEQRTGSAAWLVLITACSLRRWRRSKSKALRSPS